MSAWKDWALKISLLAFGLFLGLGLLEIGVRILKARNGSEFDSLADLRRAMLKPKVDGPQTTLADIIDPHPNDRIIYELRPNLNTNFQGVPVRTNSCGMRGGEVSRINVEDRYRIALLGDSFTFGWGVHEDESFAAVLQRELNTRSAARKVEVLNFGVPGYSTFQEVTSFLEKGGDFNVDAVLLFFIDNDFGYPFFVKDLSNPGGILSVFEFTRLLNQKKSAGLEAEKLRMQGLDPNTSLKIIAEDSRKNGYRLFFAINPRKNWGSIYRRLGALRKEEAFNFMDIRADFMRYVHDNKIEERALTLPSDPHPSAVKHDILGKVMAPYFLGDLFL